MRPSAAPPITADTLLRAYAIGIFPMAESRDDPEIHWVDPVFRGILPLTGLHISQSLAKRLRKSDYQITVDRDFTGVLAGCADRSETWISGPIATLYQDLHRMGHAHSLEVWQGARLVGGIYGVTQGAAFFGESMFSRIPSASRIAMVFLVHRLRAGGFSLFDTQFLTPHLASMGGIEIPRAEYQARLSLALRHRASFAPAGYRPDYSLAASPSAGAAGASGKMQRSGQTS